MTTDRIPLYYTFGNHMHWVDMEWLWGYAVLPGSVHDMLRFCNEPGAKGNLNFDGIGYEKLAVEAPEALAELRGAVARGQIEVVGASYAQPYGLFHGGEANVRQRVYGVRSVLRLLGVRPKTFWEEEFDFFPQLPQLLRGVGFEYASLFFQWTWHTPEVPKEMLPAIWWVGIDGSRLLTAPRGPLNLHQWPEDFEELLASPLPREIPVPGIIQWLELMPSPDWMCRAELMLPQLRKLMSHPEYELRFVTLSEYLEVARDFAEDRSYTLDDVFHGMSLGKNGDLFRRLSRESEHSVLMAEALSSLAGFFGRPYPSWDVYPTWELEEAWRELLSAQHHDNDECEGLCGHVGRRSYERSLGLSSDVTARTIQLLADRTQGSKGRTVVFNPLGWKRDVIVRHPESGECLLVNDVAPFGYRASSDGIHSSVVAVSAREDEECVTLQRGALQVVVDRSRGVIVQLKSEHFPDGLLKANHPLADVKMTRQNTLERFEEARVSLAGTAQRPEIHIERFTREGAKLLVTVCLADELDAVDINYRTNDLPTPDAGVHAAFRTTLAVDIPAARLIHDHPYGVSEIRAEGTYLRKYPTGDWMTSPQVFEEVHNPFTALQLLDIEDGKRGLLYLHDGSQAFLREGAQVHNILSLNDPWDEDYFVSELDAKVRLVPHGAISNAARWRLAQEFTRPALVIQSQKEGGDLPRDFAAVSCDAPGVVLGAFYRETEEAGMGLDGYAGTGIGHPYVLRVIEFNGEATTVRLRVAGPVAAAFRTNLLGENLQRLEVESAPSDESAAPGNRPGWSEITLDLKAREIATIYLDIVLGRKAIRDLDAHRSVWATVHRTSETS
jgi:alpha-mannosidase